MNNNQKPLRTHSRSFPKPLPRVANEFVAILAITLKPGTCKHYKTSLRAFYAFLENHRCPVKSVTRKHMTLWFTHLKEKKLSAPARAAYITCIRSYFYCLFEQQLLDTKPDNLIRQADIPRRPTYLPRPLPPEVDLELQQRFSNSDDPLQKGLLLMRNTGIRIGELISLPYHCVRTDLLHNSFLKVPLGKLDNERLVPLDEKTSALIEQIQAQGSASRMFLFENTHAKKVSYNSFRQSLNHAAQGIILPEPITTHRLRHTYATTLLTLGVSLQAIMRLLGHRDFNMTLRYADVTLNTIREEFFDALSQTQKIYAVNNTLSDQSNFQPLLAVSDLIAWLSKARNPTNSSISKQAQLLMRRLSRIKDDLQYLTNKIPPHSHTPEKLAG